MHKGNKGNGMLCVHDVQFGSTLGVGRVVVCVGLMAQRWHIQGRIGQEKEALLLPDEKRRSGCLNS
jgi:hypothetical protein